MSTKKKESVSSVKEKRGTSPSHSHSPLSFLKSSPKPKTSTSRSLDSSPSDKSTPNYLKPTLSSSLSSGDTTKLQGRKPVSNTDSGLKSNLARRRSFDKPPSPTRKSRGVSPTPGRAGASPKSERILKGAKEGGKHVHHLYARAVGALKKSASKSKKGEASTAKEPKHGDDHHTAEDDAIDHHESPIGEDENQVAADQETEQAHGEIDEDALEDESHEHEHPDADEAELSPTVLEQHKDEIVLKAESPTVDLGNDDDDEKAESPTPAEQAEQEEVEENGTNDDDQSVAGTPKEEAEEGKAEEDTTAEGEDGARLSHGKKDAGLSNDVIEEMTREQRLNKVRALAGAFETVISLQDHKKS